MATTLRNDLFIPEIIAEEVMKGFSGKLTMAASGAIVTNPSLEVGGRDRVGNTVTVPYVNDGGEADELPEGAAGSLDKLTMSTETAPVRRLYKAFSMTSLARDAKSTGRDANELAAEMLRSAFARKIDTIAMQVALTRATAGSMEYDGTAGLINPSVIVETLKLFGEELDDSQLAVWAMNPKPYWDAAQITDSTGRALYTDVVGGRLSQLGGAPVRMTAKSDLVVAGSPTTYKNLLIKRAAILAWLNPSVKIDIDRDPTADVDLIIGNMYCVVHAYGTMPNGTKPGVAVLKTR